MTKAANKPTTTQGVRLAVEAGVHGTDRVKKWFLKRLRSKHDVDDLLQEVRLRLLHVSDDLLVRQPTFYIFRVAASVLVEYAAARRKRAHIEHDLEEMGDEAAGSPADDPAYRLQLEAELDRAFACLPPMQRNVILLHKRDGLSREETAARLGLTLAQVHRYLRQGKAQLRMLLLPVKGDKP